MAIRPRDVLPVPTYCVIVMDAGGPSAFLRVAAIACLLFVLPSTRACHCRCRVTPSEPRICCQNIGPRFGATCARMPVRLAGSRVSAVSKYKGGHIYCVNLQDVLNIKVNESENTSAFVRNDYHTKISLSVAGNWLVPGTVEVVEHDLWMCNLDVSLSTRSVNRITRAMTHTTHAYMVVQIVSNG
jgi:hypothetical protein